MSYDANQIEALSAVVALVIQDNHRLFGVSTLGIDVFSDPLYISLRLGELGEHVLTFTALGIFVFNVCGQIDISKTILDREGKLEILRSSIVILHVVPGIVDDLKRFLRGLEGSVIHQKLNWVLFL